MVIVSTNLHIFSGKTPSPAMFLHIGMKMVGKGRIDASQETALRGAEGKTGGEETTPPTSYHKARALVTLGT